ncbi:MAG: protein kinase [Chloroflexi bacterium]|nr:protein kinase [Chloroflexota bacterium]
MRVKFWGVRGSVPTPLSTEQLQEKLFRALSAAGGIDLSDPAEVRAFIATLPPSTRSVVGGNTTCVEINSGDETIIIDSGSGMRPLGLSLMAHEFGRGQGTANIFLTHAHWDHLQGFPFFNPAYVPGNKLIFYAVNNDPRQYLQHQQTAPAYFPISPGQMRADMSFVQLKEGEMVQIGRVCVTSLALYHPGTAYAYRFDDGESVFVFASDGEYKQLDEANLSRFVEFYANADALAFDCQYSLRDVLISKADWGHSSAMIGVDIAERARVKKLITTHYDPTDNDDQVYNIAESARRYADLIPSPGSVEIIVGAEGLELFLGPPLKLEILEDCEADIWLTAFAGRLGLETASQAEAHLKRFIAKAPGNRVIIDLTLLAAIDPVGVKAMLEAARHVSGSRVAFVAPAAFVRRALENSETREIGPIFRRRSHAIAALVGPAHLHLHEQTLAGYHLADTIAADDFGAIYSASKLRDETPLVIQVMGLEINLKQRQSFAESAKRWCQLTHPRLIRGRELIENGKLIAFVGERPTGDTWGEWLRANGSRLQPQPGLLWMREMVDALDHAHRHGVVHGELRPECFVFNNGHARISRAPLFPPVGVLPSAYRASEQLRGEAATPGSDHFALGVLLYEALVGTHPFTAEMEELIIAQQLQGTPLSPRVFRPNLSAELEQFLLRLLGRDQSERFASAEDILKAIDELL